METSFVESTTQFEPLLNDIDDDEGSETEDNAGSGFKSKKRDSSAARRKIEEYLEMKNLERQTYDYFCDELYLNNG